ncbi:hypothetical protein QJS04_geneDACA008942 [Acorus gramineus]|uniref:Protein PAM68, chloroplastic n=1 Tax=Acorus gramineus TaxID=55184 RepID=A0AAV9AET9_ACOGR|nr:hypothetical protein QJS04_geneDACA008942 [Acorus gramineus]
MESLTILRYSLTPPNLHTLPSRKHPLNSPKFPKKSPHHLPHPPLALKTPRGFGAPPEKNKRKKKSAENRDEGPDDDDDEEEEEEEVMIPEVVTNRMMSRMGLTVGIPLTIGLMFFPFFYYLKVVAKVDVPTWVPVIVSFFFFGSALLGVSYGIVSSSWDPLREGSLLGWTEAQRNWPLFWESLWGNKSGKKS